MTEESMTPEQQAAIEAAIGSLVGHIVDATAHLPAGVVMSALFTCILSGAAGTPHARLIVIEHLQAAVNAIRAMGDLAADQAMVAAAGAAPGMFVKTSADEPAPVSIARLH